MAAEEQRLLPVLPATPDREVLWWLLLGFFALFVAGFYLMRVPGAAEGNPLGVDRAIFSALGAVTLTGMRQEVSTSPFAGGSLLVPATLLALTLGGSYLTLLATSIPACKVLGMPHRVGRIAAAAGVLVGGGTLLGMVVSVAGARGWADGRAYLEGLVAGASAVGNSGVFWGAAPRPDAAATHLGLLPLAVVGGLGLPVLLDLYDRLAGRTPALSFHTKLVLRLTAVAYAVGVVGLLASNDRFWTDLAAAVRGWRSAGGDAPPGWAIELRSLFLSSAALSVESRSAGFPSVAVNSLPRATNWVLALLMAVGASPAGTAGGLKVTTLYLLGRGLRQALRGERLPPVFGFAVAWAAAFLAIVFAGHAALLWTAPQVSADQLLTAAVSATGNCGLTHDTLAVVQAPLLILGGMMLLGRVVPTLLLWRMADRLEYAETVPG